MGKEGRIAVTDKKKRVEIVAIILLVAFFEIAFAFSFKMNAVFWIAYIFGMFSMEAQLVVSLIFMLLAVFVPAWVAVLVNVLLFAAIGIIGIDVVRDEVQHQEVKI